MHGLGEIYIGDNSFSPFNAGPEIQKWSKIRPSSIYARQTQALRKMPNYMAAKNDQNKTLA